MKRIISLMLTLAVALSLLILPTGAASTPEEALGEVNIYSGGYSMNYLAVNGRADPVVYLLPLRKRRRGDPGDPSVLCKSRSVRRTPNGPRGGEHPLSGGGKSVRP